MSDAITLERAKQHLRVEHGDEDALIELLIKTALRGVRDYIDRPLTDAICRDEEDELLLAAPFQYAQLLMIGDMYENREAQQMVTLNINMTCQNLMNPYRKMGV